MADRVLRPNDYALAAELHEPIGRLYWLQGMCMRKMLRTLCASDTDGSHSPPDDDEALAIQKRTLEQATIFLRRAKEAAKLERGHDAPMPGELAHDILV